MHEVPSIKASFSRPLAELLDPLLGVVNEGLPCIHFKLAIVCCQESAIALLWLQLLKDETHGECTSISSADVTLLQQFHYCSPRSGATVYVEIALCCGLPATPSAASRWTAAFTACTAVVVLASATDATSILVPLVAKVTSSLLIDCTYPLYSCQLFSHSLYLFVGHGIGKNRGERTVPIRPCM